MNLALSAAKHVVAHPLHEGSLHKPCAVSQRPTTNQIKTQKALSFFFLVCQGHPTAFMNFHMVRCAGLEVDAIGQTSVLDSFVKAGMGRAAPCPNVAHPWPWRLGAQKKQSSG